MADYHSLIVRAVEGLSDRSPEMRRAVYERARTALLSQLRSLDPPLSEADIERESISLNDAIQRIEATYEPIASEGPEATAAATTADISAPPLFPTHLVPPVADEIGEGVAEDAPVLRPRIKTQSPSGLRIDRKRTILLGTVLVLVIAVIAVTAWVLRDKPSELASAQPSDTQNAQVGAEASGKFSERVGGSSTSPLGKAAQSGQDIGVAQRAVLYEEDPSNPQTPKADVGHVVWRLETINAGQGQPLETAVRGIIEIPGANLTLNLLLRRNQDATLPASHTVELNFTTKPGDSNRIVRDIGLLQFKDEEAARGTPIAGLPVPVRENFFLIGLSNLSGDIDRNVELFIHRNWIDLPVRMGTGQRAILSFEKGTSGNQVISDAFRQWQ